jgi:putative RNA 2'-phosphotransferase
MNDSHAKPKSTDISRTLSHALRHEPWLYELELDEEGWVDLLVLVSAIRTLGGPWSLICSDDIVQAVGGAAKARHQISDGRIRALYGHSLPGRLKKSVGIPPDRLFHGTSSENAQAISESGLLPMGRQYVHLSLDTEMALTVASRKSSRRILFRVESLRAHLSGIRYYVGNDQVWLSDSVPASFLELADVVHVIANP